MDRFNKVAIQIEKISDEQAIEALKNGTCLGMLRDKININEPTTFSEAMAMATKLIKMDEDRRLRPYEDRAPPKREERFESRRARPQYSYSRSPVLGHASSFRKEVENFTPLNTTRSKVLMWIRANGVGIPFSRKLSPSKRAFLDRRFYCQYHREYGHDTDTCKDLQRAIEQLIKMAN